ncbi:class I SAM-dependent methyltransferase [Nitrospira sp. Nam80]
MKSGLNNHIGEKLAALLPDAACAAFAKRLSERNPQLLLEALGPKLNRRPSLDTMPFDLPPAEALQFEDLAGLFASTSLDHGVIAMTIRQTAYLFGLVRRLRPSKIIEIGRYKGGSTLTIAAAMNGYGEFWSIDIGEKEARLHQDSSSRSFDDQIRDLCAKFGLRVTLLVGDSRTIELQTGDVDLVFIDGDHSYDGVRTDFERFGRRVKVGGAVLFDDATDETLFQTHAETVGRLVREIISAGDHRLVKSVDRLAHLERLR